MGAIEDQIAALKKKQRTVSEQYQACQAQARSTLNASDRPVLGEQAERFKKEYEDLNREIERLRRGESPDPAGNDPEDGAAAPGRLALDLLNKLLYSQFQEVVFRYPVPPQHLPQNVAQSQQAIAVIQYALQREREDLKQLLNTIGQVAPHLSSS
jgi:hypothetical protein